MQAPLVSIITPCFNVENYVALTIQSIIEQTYENWELIIVDDCSTDSTVEIITEFANNEPRIKLLKNYSNCGSPAKVRNVALQHVKGKYIAFLDSDDLWMKDKLTFQVSKMEESPLHSLCYTGGVTIDEFGNLLGIVRPTYPDGRIFSHLLKQYNINAQSVMVRSDCLNSLSVPRFNEELVIAEDFDLFMRLASKFSVCSINKQLFKYRIRPSSLTNTRFDLFALSMEKALDSILASRNDDSSHELDLRFIHAKISYYHALYFKSMGFYLKPILLLSKSCLLGLNYFLVFLLAFTPKVLWTYVHILKRKR